MPISILEEIKEDNREAAEWLLYYPFRRRQFYKDKQDAICSSQMPEVMARTGPGNPTAQRAMRLSGLGKCEQWLAIIEIVEDHLDEKKLVFLRCRREAAYITRNVKGRPAWVIYVQRHYANEMAKCHGKNPEEFWLSERTMQYWWEQIVGLTVRIAMKMNKL